MRLRNGEHGYGLVTKLLHWLTVAVVVAQLTVGWTMDVDAAADRADAELDAYEDRAEEGAEARGEAAEERFEAEMDRREEAVDALEDSPGSEELSDVVGGTALGDGLSAVEVHVLLGLALLVLALLRIGWRQATPLPPWAPHLSARERAVESLLEKALLGLLLLVPATGLLLALTDADLLALHVAAQVALLLAVAGHVGLVLSHTLGRRNRHLARML